MILNFEYFNYYYYRSCIEINKTKSNDTERKKPGEYIKLRLIGKRTVEYFYTYVCRSCLSTTSRSFFILLLFWQFLSLFKRRRARKKREKTKKKQISGWMDGWMDG